MEKSHISTEFCTTEQKTQTFLTFQHLNLKIVNFQVKQVTLQVPLKHHSLNLQFFTRSRRYVYEYPHISPPQKDFVR